MSNISNIEFVLFGILSFAGVIVVAAPFAACFVKNKKKLLRINYYIATVFSVISVAYSIYCLRYFCDGIVEYLKWINHERNIITFLMPAMCLVFMYMRYFLIDFENYLSEKGLLNE